VSSAHKLIIARSALAAAEQAAASRIPRETGGILIGFRAADDVYVADVLEVADDQSTGCRFVLREDSREEALARYRHEAPPECPFGYVGGWHSHPAQALASSRDMKTLHQEAKTAQDLVAMMILMRAPNPGLSRSLAAEWRA
jgi:proteasome lid subunit RPN8/RPN11